MQYFGFVISQHFLLSLNFDLEAAYLVVQALYALVFLHTFILQQGHLEGNAAVKRTKYGSTLTSDRPAFGRQACGLLGGSGKHPSPGTAQAMPVDFRTSGTLSEGFAGN